MTEADAWRLCKHPETTRITRPEPVRPHNVVRWIVTPRMTAKPDIHRCIACGQVGELGRQRAYKALQGETGTDDHGDARNG